MRLQLALNVERLDEAVEFYSKLFATEPAKQKPGYANFAIEDPPLKLVLFEGAGSGERLNHLGVEVLEENELMAATTRLQEAGLASDAAGESTCCYAKQNKVWAYEPQGLQWEYYQVLEESETFAGSETDPDPDPEPEVEPVLPRVEGCC